MSLNSFIKGVVRAAGAIIGGELGGPAGAAVGGGLATKLTGGSTNDAIGVGAISGIGSWAMGGLGGRLDNMVGGGPDLTAAQAGDGSIGGGSFTDIASGSPSFTDRGADLFSRPSTLAALGIGGLVAGGDSRAPEAAESNRAASPSMPEGWDIPAPAYEPLRRARRARTGDPSRYGETGGEWRYYDEVNPRSIPMRRGGRVRGIGHYADGGRTYTPVGGDLTQYGYGGEHQFYSPWMFPLGEPDDGADDGDDDRVIEVTPTGEIDTGGIVSGGGDASPGGVEAGTSDSFGEWVSDAFTGLNMMGPIGLGYGLISARDGMPGNLMVDAAAAARDAINGRSTAAPTAFSPLAEYSFAAPQGIALSNGYYTGTDEISAGYYGDQSGRAGLEGVGGVVVDSNGNPVMTDQGGFLTYGNPALAAQAVADYNGRTNAANQETDAAVRNADNAQTDAALQTETEAANSPYEGNAFDFDLSTDVSSDGNSGVSGPDGDNGGDAAGGDLSASNDGGASIDGMGGWGGYDGGGFDGGGWGGGDAWKRGGEVPGRRSSASPAARAGSIRGPGSGQSDEIPAMLSNDEHVIDADVVAALGDGSSDAGHAVLENMKKNVRAHKRRAGNKKIPPPAKGIGEYMRQKRSA